MILETLHKYCCKDSAVTHEISGKLDRFLHGGPLEHYRFNISLLNPLLYMELRGIKYDSELAKRRKAEIDTKIYELQHALDTLSNHGLPTEDKNILRKLVRDTMCYKRDPTRVKSDYTHCYTEIMRLLLSNDTLNAAHLGRISTELNLHLNTKGKDFKSYLYDKDKLHLPIQLDSKTKAPTTDYLALLELKKWVEKQ